MAIQIRTERDIAKFIAFMTGRVAADFHVAQEVAALLVEKIRQYAEQNNVGIEIMTPDNDVILAFTASGALIGGAAGYVIGGLPGAIAGTVAGAAMGYSVAHLRFTWEVENDTVVLRPVH